MRICATLTHIIFQKFEEVLKKNINLRRLPGLRVPPVQLNRAKYLMNSFHSLNTKLLPGGHLSRQPFDRSWKLVKIINGVSIGINRGLNVNSLSDDNLQQLLRKDVNPSQMLLQLRMVNNLGNIMLAVGRSDGHFDFKQRAEQFRYLLQ